MQYELVSRTGQQPTLSIFGSFGAKVITTTHPFFSKVVEYLTTNPEDEHDESEIAVLLDPALRLGAMLAEVSDRVTYSTGAIYLDGIRLHPLIERHILERNEADDMSWDRLVRFLLKVDENPSRQSQEALYQWLTEHGLQITEDGDFVGYKGVDNHLRSISTGPNNFIDGVLYGTPGVSYAVPYAVGTVVSKKRADVDDDIYTACSHGLHVGTYDYARRWGSRLITVKINPRDVVSVPGSDLTWKIRVCRLEVLSVNDEETQFEGYTYDEGDESPYDEADEGIDLLPDEDEGDFQGIPEAETLREIPTLDPEDVPVEDDDPDQSLLEYTPEQNEVWFDSSVEEPQDEPQEPVYASLAEAEEADDRFVLGILKDRSIGHKPAARRLQDEGGVSTTEASVRRWRKANGVSLTLRAKVSKKG